MRISIDRATLAHALTAVSKVVESRNTIPILSNVLLEVKQGRLTIRGTDLDMEASTSIAVLDASDGETTADAKLLTDIVKKATGDVSLETDGDVLTVKSGRARYRLQTLPAGDYPTLDAGTFDVEFDVDLAALVAPTQFAISTEETRYYLNGVYLHTVGATPGDRKLVAVATDGHRMARHYGGESSEFTGVILPRKLVGLLPKGPVHLSLSERKVRIETEEAVLTSKLIDGTFPDYQRVIPMSNPHRLAADRDALLAAVERVTVVSSERGRAVRLAATDGRLVLSVEDKAQEELDVAFEWPATVEGQPNEPFTIGFNGQYLQDVLRTFAPGVVTFWLNDAGSPTRLTGTDEGLDAVIMPMRVV